MFDPFHALKLLILDLRRHGYIAIAQDLEANLLTLLELERMGDELDGVAS